MTMQALEITKNISQIFPEGIVVDAAFDPEIKGMSLDSRQIKEDYLFVAKKGSLSDGREFIDDAIEKGASVILSELSAEDGMQDALGIHESGKPIYRVSELEETLGKIAAAFFEEPSKRIKLVAIVGTNGKTSCSHFLAQALSSAGHKVGVLGTIGNGLLEELSEGPNTTMDVLSNHEMLAQLVQSGAEYVIMEVSSHAIDQKRIAGLEFAQGIFTNLSQDHLDYHGTMENYKACKASFFLQQRLPSAVVNADDALGAELVESLDDAFRVSTDIEVQADIHIDKALADKNGLEIEFLYQGQSKAFHNEHLLGAYNVENISLVVSALLALGKTFKEALVLAESIEAVPGRMECFGGQGAPLVVVDYAHTPDALAQALKSLKSLAEIDNEGEIVLVFGCGGDRDKSKRALMAKVAEDFAGEIIVTSDNPRTESQEVIVSDIIKGFSGEHVFRVETDRATAIKSAILSAGDDDIVLIAGKGHEKYQEIAGERLVFDDVALAKTFLRERKGAAV